MNERIKLLAEEANLEIDPGSYLYNQKVLEKFAQLIVYECATFLNTAVEVHTQADQDVCMRAAKGLKNYFELNNE